MRRGKYVADRFVTNILRQQCRAEEEHTEQWEETRSFGYLLDRTEMRKRYV
jgi:hypothetical protein